MRQTAFGRALRLLASVAFAFVIGSGGAQAQQAKPSAAPAAKPESIKVDTCYGCHTNMKEFHAAGKHKNVSCASCHEGLAAHLGNPTARPKTSMAPATCGACHKAQYESMYTMDWHRAGRTEKKLATGPAPDPAFDRLMTPHGFTKEHNLPRSHSFAVLDQFVVDRAFGGRFGSKDGWRYLTRGGGDFKVWDVIEDLYPDNTDQKPFKPGTAAAANPVCINCKTTDHILDWAYMGDPVPGAKWSRTSKVVEMAKAVNHSVNCNFCHDPHAAKPRIVRDGLIQAVTRTDFPTLYSQDPRKQKVDVKTLGMRGFERKVGMLERYEGKLQCGQCHVEYNCNPGIDPKTGQPITMADRRTNLFPFVDVANISKFYDSQNFRDFRHFQTGALLTKMQHPDVEVFYNSKHDKAGVDCASCHMPKVKGKDGKFFTSHWQTNPRQYIKETCLQCHQAWDERQVKYMLESMVNHYQGKVRHAEFWLNQLIDQFQVAQALAVDPAALSEARAKHDEAHANWEWWTASNGSAFHDLDEAKESLAKSVAASQAGIKILQDAIKAKTTAATPAPQPAAPAAPAPAQKSGAAPGALPHVAAAK
jgi:formate-dependent nitrite reductase cytochrome c552 subunit